MGKARRPKSLAALTPTLEAALMTHADNSGFLKALKETFTAYSFDLVGLVAGFIVAYQLHIFEVAPWAIALYPAVLGAKGIIEGLLSGRLVPRCTWAQCTQGFLTTPKASTNSSKP
jgi:cation transporter-like permease